MLWEISDFKGIESAHLDIRPGKATILTGVNSSGKSSTLQSLLLAAQSLYNEGPVVLNGPLVRLGDAQDLVRESSSTGHIGIRLSVDTHLTDGALHDEPLSAEYELVATEDRSSLRAKRIGFTSPSFPGQDLELARANSRGSDVELAMQATRHFGPREVLHVKALLGSDKRQLRTYAVMQGLRPIGLVQLMAPERVASIYRAEFESILSESGRDEQLEMKRSGITPQVAREFVRLLAEAAHEDKKLVDISKRFSHARSGNPYLFDSVWSDLTTSERSDAIGAVAAQRARRAYSLLPIKGPVLAYGSPVVGLLESALGNALGTSFDALGALNSSLDELSRRVQYLGPLRDEPRVVWNHWNELARGLPVGTRGEFSAAVLSRSANDAVQYCPPGQARTVDRLSTAVNRWLEYLQIGDRINARSRGKLGVGFELHLDGHIRDLTSVGVGVSQTLPLLVGLLSAPHDSVFIVEQPELHLHPAVQARLADFMLSARPDVSLIIETHSDAFITRIRRRAAEGSIDTSDVDITFIESKSGGARTRTLKLSEFGDLDEWPDGFLSSSEDDIRAILKMNIERARGATGD
ncbi:AAA family ATPase [Leifsonia sp. Leaf264]|uniref:AAA family ATPase n=1 Tax=Leifsonia sp. Leaf264 TaxID=1736314 RepID=UPI000AE06543|nr:DUF3696 domain-containing protein [Leifsonia sp. Leaf264]